LSRTLDSKVKGKIDWLHWRYLSFMSMMY